MSENGNFLLLRLHNLSATLERYARMEEYAISEQQKQEARIARQFSSHARPDRAFWSAFWALAKLLSDSDEFFKQDFIPLLYQYPKDFPLFGVAAKKPYWVIPPHFLPYNTAGQKLFSILLFDTQIPLYSIPPFIVHGTKDGLLSSYITVQNFLGACYQICDPVKKGMLEQQFHDLIGTPINNLTPMYSTEPLIDLVQDLFDEWGKFISRHSSVRSIRQPARFDLYRFLFASYFPEFSNIWEPENSFFLLDDTLFLIAPQRTIEKRGLIITPRTLETFFFLKKLPRESYKLVADMLPLYQSHLYQARKAQIAVDQEKPADSSNHSLDLHLQFFSPSTNPSSFNIKDNPEGEKRMHYYDPKTQQFYVILFESCPRFTNIYDIGRKELVSPVLSSDNKVPNLDFLFHLTKGKMSVFDDFARLLAYCLCSKKLFRGIIVFQDKSIYDSILVMLQSLTDIAPLPELEISTLCRKKTLNCLIQAKIDGQFLLPLSVSTRKNGDAFIPALSDEKRKIFKKIVSGATLTHADSLLGRKKHCNAAQCIMFCPETLLPDLKKLGLPLFLPQLNVPIETALTPAQINFLQMFALPFGIMQCYKKKKAQPSLPPEQSVHDFLQRCCLVAKEAEEQASVLYARYCDFCTHSSYMPLKFKHFNLALDKNFKRYRPHYKSQSNPYYFMGLKLIDEKVESTVVAHPEERFLHTINELVKDINSRILVSEQKG